jgi:hypothetical protein
MTYISRLEHPRAFPLVVYLIPVSQSHQGSASDILQRLQQDFERYYRTTDPGVPKVQRKEHDH